MPNGLTRRSFLLNAAAASFASAPAAAQTVSQPASVSISNVAVTARQIESFDPRDSSHVRYGALEFRSGLVLTSPFKGFGGFSALSLDRKGEQFLSLNDKGDWFTGRLVYARGKLKGLANVQSAPMRGADGRRITARRGWFDTESLARDGPLVYVGLERVNQILRFDFAKGGILARGEVVPVPPGIAELPYNKGLESLVFVPRDMKGQQLAGTLIAISERALDAAGNIQAFLLSGQSPGEFSVKRTKNFDISDATLLPSGDLLVLERKFSLLEGVGIRIRRIPLASVKPGAVIDGPTIFEVDLGYEIDNMEGIDTHVDENGDTVITMISDDNFSMIQRTLLLQFTLVDA